MGWKFTLSAGICLAFLGWGSKGLFHPLEVQASGLDPDLSTLYNVDLRDLARYRSRSFPAARQIVESMTRTPWKYFPEEVRFSPEGVGRMTGVACAANFAKLTRRALSNQVYGVEIHAPPIEFRDRAVYPVRALIHHRTREASGFFFREYEITIEGGRPDVRQVRDIPIHRTRFSARVGLLQRKLILTDSVYGIRKVFPIGVGGFDEGITEESEGRVRLLTPTFRGARLKAEWAERDRQDKDYYCGMPFIRVQRKPRSRRDNGWTAIGFHISQHRELVRGFDSHGCMRLREKDLYELYYILKNHGDGDMPVEIALSVDEEDEHPFPLTNDRYQTVKDCNNPSRPPRGCERRFERWEQAWRKSRRRKPPASCRETETELTVTREFRCRPPIASLHGIEALDGDRMNRSQLIRHGMPGDRPSASSEGEWRLPPETSNGALTP